VTGEASVAFLCPACSARVRASGLRARCERCAAEIELGGGGGFEAGEPLRACAVCGAESLHVARDFNKNLGVAIVALGATAFYWGALAGIGTLAALTVLDRIVYALRPEVTVCYACKAVYRGLPKNPQHRPYELTYDETFEGTGQKPRFRAGGGLHDGGPSADGAQSP
jgi:hypothetical protein